MRSAGDDADRSDYEDAAESLGTAGAGGADGIRTHDLDGANVALSQLSYGPGTKTGPRRMPGRGPFWVGGADGDRTHDL